jgi:hypothetical protein
MDWIISHRLGLLAAVVNTVISLQVPYKTESSSDHLSN